MPTSLDHSLPSQPAVAERFGAALVAASAWLGLSLQTLATLGVTGDAVLTLFALSRYFTILTNLACAVVFTRIALGARPAPGWLGGVVACIVTVGVVYALLLNGLFVLPGLGALANIFLHRATPIAAVLFWLFLAPKGDLQNRHTIAWLTVLAAYGAYALARGAVEQRAVYPFLDPEPRGWGSVALTMAIMGFAFAIAGLALVRLDKVLAPRRL